MDFTNPELWLALLTLSALEIVLGIDNIIFLSIVAGKLPIEQQAKARFWGLLGAMGTRIGLLASLAWLAKLTADLFHIGGMGISGRDLILFLGGLFLLYKAGKEIAEMLASPVGHPDVSAPIEVKKVTFTGAIVQIAMLDIVFSLDSVITAVGMTDNLPIMITAIVIAIITMMMFSGALSRFVDANPTIKMLALAFLVLIGLVLMAEGLDVHIPKAYVYAAMGFSVSVELLNLRMRKAQVAQRAADGA